MPNILAIVGRPNVGKSTLFNRILNERSAIVDDMPGVTRDRHYGVADWTGKIFTVIDTGGYVPNSDDLFEQAIREQAEIAIEEASAVIFVVDGMAGITPLDEEIASILRKRAKIVFLAVNKIDSAQREAHAAQFFRLGFGDPLAISALGGRMIGDFLDAVTKKFSLPGEETEDRSPALKIAIVGKPNVGKSSIVNALLGKERTIVTDRPGTTRDSVDSVLRDHGEDVILIDTAGLRHRSRIKESVEFYSVLRSLKSIERCDVAFMVIDVSTGIDRQDLRVLESIMERRRAVVLVANKWDLIEKDDQTARGYEKEIKKILRMYDFVPVVFTSALQKKRIPKLIEIARKLHAEQLRRIPTNKLNSELLRRIESTPPASVRGKEVKINYITQSKGIPPSFIFFSNEPSVLEAKYKRFLERSLREAFGFEGVPLLLLFRKKR
ncbi:MAG TPA: ribosome biogenesis GTPase Der [Bacteroidota bacterium]|nr:ribosome biogenesis GTPase Der [Bacteroidota bacterium]